MFNNDFEKTEGRDLSCPYCESDDTEIFQSCGPATCRSVYICNECQEYFESMKSRTQEDS